MLVSPAPCCKQDQKFASKCFSASHEILQMVSRTGASRERYKVDRKQQLGLGLARRSFCERQGARARERIEAQSSGTDGWRGRVLSYLFGVGLLGCPTSESTAPTNKIVSHLRDSHLFPPICLLVFRFLLPYSLIAFSLSINMNVSEHCCAYLTSSSSTYCARILVISLPSQPRVCGVYVSLGCRAS